jgi:hypothetical protein
MSRCRDAKRDYTIEAWWPSPVLVEEQAPVQLADGRLGGSSGAKSMVRGHLKWVSRSRQ